MGDKGGKKDKEKGQKQNAEKQKQKSNNKLDKQPKKSLDRNHGAKICTTAFAILNYKGDVNFEDSL